MPKPPDPPVLSERGFAVSGQSGLVIPRAISTFTQPVETLLNGLTNGKGFNAGVPLKRDEDTLAVKWPMKGSGWDDFVNQSIVDGTVANVGVSPVVAPEISAVVRRQQNQAATASIDLTGRTYPTKQARDALARFNDSPLGATQALEQIVYGICTYNRGAPIATVPITYSFDVWEQYGLNAVPMPAPRQKPENATRYYLEVDWAKHGTPVPFLPSIYDLEPTGIAEWPYWYRVRRSSAKNDFVWVLLHQTHILSFTPGTTSKPGIGTSPVWMCLGVLAEQILIIEERAEKLLYSLSDGLILLGGVESVSGQTLETSMESARVKAMNRGMMVSKGHTILTSPHAEKVSVATVSFRQPPNIEFQKWREYVEDKIAQCFGEALSAIVIRGGVGFGVQSDTAADNTSESGVGAILYGVGIALGAIYPRVQVSVSRPNDRAQRLNISTLKDFAQAAVPLVRAGILSGEQAQAIIDRDIMTIPQVGADTVVATANADDSTDEVDETKQGAGQEPETISKTEVERASVRTARAYDAQTSFGAATLYDDDGVTVTDEDVALALERARTRVDEDLYELLTATAVEE